MRSWAASSARPSGSTSTPPRSPWSSPSSIATSPRATPPELFDIYPLLSKWGFLNLGVVTGGVSLLFAEALAGVISWSIAAWLFAINRTFMSGLLPEGRDADPRALHARRADPAHART